MMSLFQKFSLFVLVECFVLPSLSARQFTIGESTQIVYSPTSFTQAPSGGDTVVVLSARKTRLQFRALEGNSTQPIVFINKGGAVHIKGGAMPAIMFENCKYIKISGRGEATLRYGFVLSGPSFGLSFEQYCSDCEAENLRIDSCSLGIHAKKDFGGHPPVPYPLFSRLALHDNYITHCSESMYIGETKSPGMEFKHVRIYNNIILHSGRESFQIANCVDDIEAYNNFCYDSGLENSIGQLNNSQLGGNSIGKFYNNVFIKAPGCGVAIFGKGDMTVEHNYFEDNQGVFSDDRYEPIHDADLRIRENYFRNQTNALILDIRNSFFNLFFTSNRYNNAIPFYKANQSLVKENYNNQLQSVAPFLYSLENELYTNQSVASEYQNIGPIAGLSHTFNETPVIDFVPDIIQNVGTMVDYPIRASVADFDSIQLYAKYLPPFASFTQTTSGNAILRVDGRNQSKGVYQITLCAVDKSGGAIARQLLKIALKSLDNHPTTMSIPSSLTLEAATKQQVVVTASDADGDSIRFTILEKPAFVDFTQSASGRFFVVKPTFTQRGDYRIILKAEDGYSAAVIDTLWLHINAPSLSAGRCIYRVNYGGGELEDAPINWQKDAGDVTSYEANYSMGTGSATWSGVNTTGAPNNLFGPFRYNGIGQTEMLFKFPCVANGRYQVNLFFAERSNEVQANAIEQFSVYLENVLRESGVNIYQAVGYSALKKSYEVDVYDSIIDLTLKKELYNCKLNGVEIRYLNAINQIPKLAVADTLIAFAGKENRFDLTITDDRFAGCTAYSVLSDLSTLPASIEQVGEKFSLLVTPASDVRGLFPATLTVSDGCGSSTKPIVIRVVEFHPNAPQWSALPLQQVYEGEKDTVFVTFTDADGDAIQLSAIGTPSFSSFSSVNGVGRLLVNPTYTDAGDYQFEVTAKDNYGLATTQIISFRVKESQPIQRILLNNTMVHDLVTGVSVNSPTLLVDEQSLDPMLNQHPVSLSWKPYYTEVKAPYHIYFDLGKKYVIRKLLLHDMNNVSPLSISTGSPSNWKEEFTYLTNTYNYWKSFETDYSSQFLRFTQWNASSAEINEVALYGYPEHASPLLLSAKNYIIPLNGNDTLHIQYSSNEGGNVQLFGEQLPEFADLQQMGSGEANLYLFASQKSIGKYAFALRAVDGLNYTSRDTLTIEVKDFDQTSLKESKEELPKVLYNRVKEELRVISSNEAFQIELLSVNGLSWMRSTTSPLSISHLPKGVYIVLLKSAMDQQIQWRGVVIK